MPDVIYSLTDRNPWDIQDYEFTESFRIFSTYYLPLKPPRTIRQAFEKMLIEEQSYSSKTAKQTLMPPEFIKWSLALDAMGDKIPDALSWHERAVLYDDARYNDYKEQIKGTQLDTIVNEIRDVEQVEIQWRVLYDEFLAWAKHAREQAKLAGIPYNPDKEITRIKDLFDIREKLSQFSRRAVGLPVKFSEVPASEKDDLFKMEWNEPPKLITDREKERVIEILRE
jgi:hypothetical protein